MGRMLVLALGISLCIGGLAMAGPMKSSPPVIDPTVPQPGWKAPRNAMGQPDLSGYWNNATLTPLTRNPDLTAKSTLTPGEAKALEKAFADAQDESNSPTDPSVTTVAFQAKASDAKLLAIRPSLNNGGGNVGLYNAFWLDPGNSILEVNGEFRTSILTTPDGQPPARKPGAAALPPRTDVYDNPEDRSRGERCIMSFGRNAIPPMLPNGFYNNDYYIIQTPETVAIQIEQIHDVRVVRLNSQHRTDGVRPSMGDSIGHFEGDTLVVETTNLPEVDGFMGSWKKLKVTERFTRISPTRVNYRFQVEDPDTWDKPWGGEYDFAPMKGIIYEYACHEGNYALRNILAGARAKEHAAAGPVPAAAAGGDR